MITKPGPAARGQTGGTKPGRSPRSATGRLPGTGYLERMARPRLTEAARVSIALKVSQVDAARIDEVLTRPEFAGWTRAEWCREIIRTALRYYAGDPPPPDPGRARAAAQPATAQPATAQPVPPGPPPPAAGESAAAAGQPGPDGLEPPAPLESPAPAGCPHPADARDYERGACGACGAILWD